MNLRQMIEESREAARRAFENDPLRAFHVWWDHLEQADCDALKERLSTAQCEQDMQTLLHERPLLLVQHLRGGHGRWVIPQARLGSNFVTDFLICEAHSFGRDWTAVELESPKARMFKRNGDPSATLTHAIRQIQDWRLWVKKNLDYAIRPKDESGLGLTGISGDMSGLIILGRREDIATSTNGLREQMCIEHNVRIHSYDTLVDWAMGRLSCCEAMRAPRQDDGL